MQDLFDKFFAFMAVWIIIAFLAGIAVAGGIGYVAWHFISKFW